MSIFCMFSEYSMRADSFSWNARRSSFRRFSPMSCYFLGLELSLSSRNCAKTHSQFTHSALTNPQTTTWNSGGNSQKRRCKEVFAYEHLMRFALLLQVLEHLSLLLDSQILILVRGACVVVVTSYPQNDWPFDEPPQKCTAGSQLSVRCS